MLNRLKKLPARQIALFVMFVVVACFFCGEYLGKLNIPTDAAIRSKMTALSSARGNLMFAKQEFAQREKLLEELALSSAKYWVPGNGSKLEQEINAEIGKILRKAQVQATQKVDASRERNGSFLQEVYVSIEMKSVSMQSIARFFKEFANYKNAQKFVWENCKIGPDNSRAPNGVNLTLKFKVMALNEDAVKLLNDGNN